MIIRIGLLFRLFVTFLKVGAFTVGGGYAMLPVIQHEVTDKKKWVDDERMTDYLTLAQASPGIIGINAATAVGWHVAGLPGALAAALGMSAPSVVVITLIAMVFENFMQLELVMRAFKGVRAAVVALMLTAVIRIFKTSVKTRFQLIVAAAAALTVIVLDVKPQYVILAGGAAGVAASAILERNARSCKR